MNLSFRYQKVTQDIYRPIIPLQVSHEDGTSTTIAALLDSGSDVMLFPRGLAKALGLVTGKKIHEVDGVGGKVAVSRSRVRVSLSDGKKSYRIPHPLEVSVQVSDGLIDEVLIGRIPFFQEFVIEFNENAKRVRLVPSHRH
jgi:hypothetical protein